MPKSSPSSLRLPLVAFALALGLSLLATYPLVATPSDTESASTEPTVAPGDEEVVPQTFEKHYLVLLMRPENPTAYDDEKSAEIQSAHLAHLYQLWVDGHSLIAGPFEVPADERMRGLVLFDGDLTLEEVRELAESDPAVKAGRLEVKVLPWWHGAELMKFEPPPVPTPSE